LTAFDLDRPSDHAIDRLIVEPVVAGGEVAGRDRVVVDIGSGGGSPALPLKILLPRVQMTLVEARVRKAAFLREAVRELGLEDVRIETVRLGRGGLPSVRGAADVVTIRAVRMDADVLDGLAELLSPEGRVFWFNAEGRPPAGWRDVPVRDAASRFMRIMAPNKVK
jgi:16S rRNA (guanine527-N7)-methyltransferase